MKAGLLLCVIFFLPLVGDHERPGTAYLTASPSLDTELHQIREKATALFQRSNYADAASLYAVGLEKAQHGHATTHVGRFLMGMGNCAFAAFEYREAVYYHLRAAEIARGLGDNDRASAVAESLSSIYLRMGDYTSAAASLEEALSRGRYRQRRATLLLNAAILYANQNHTARAIQLFTEGIEQARLESDRLSEVKGLNSLGWHYLRRGHVEKAAETIELGFSLRQNLGIKEVAAAYRNLGLLRVAQGNTHEGIRLLKEAVTAARKNPTGALMWNLQYYLARTLEGAGRHAEALESYESALNFARTWRVGVIPADTTQLGADVALQRIYDDYIAALMRQFEKRPDSQLAWTMLAAAEENRERSYNERLFDAKAVPPGYWRALNQCRKAEIALLTENTAKNRSAAANMRLKLTELESQLGLLDETAAVPKGHSVLVAGGRKKSHRKNESILSDNPLFHLRSDLRPDEALLSFHTGRNESYLWAVTNNHIEIHKLPGKLALSARAGEFRESIRAGTGAGSEQLYGLLFGGLTRRISSRTRWALVLDDGLFELPLAALKTDGRYLPEVRSVRLLPFAAMVQRRPQPIPNGTFLGVADPIYNVADSRWKAREPRKSWLLRLLRLQTASAVEDSSQMPRLVSSRSEVEMCSRAWGPSNPASLLTGAQTNRLTVEHALESGAAVAHFATHVVQRPDSPEQTWIAIGLNPAGQMDFLTPAEISARKFRIGLVTLSGCSSGAGRALPGIGLFGLARAWLTAGVQTVTATYWPTPDEGGNLLRTFYANLSQSEMLTAVGAAEALRAAQLEMLRSNTWRSDPRYWAAFFVAGKD